MARNQPCRASSDRLSVVLSKIVLVILVLFSISVFTGATSAFKDEDGVINDDGALVYSANGVIEAAPSALDNHQAHGSADDASLQLPQPRDLTEVVQVSTGSELQEQVRVLCFCFLHVIIGVNPEPVPLSFTRIPILTTRILPP